MEEFDAGWRLEFITGLGVCIARNAWTGAMDVLVVDDFGNCVSIDTVSMAHHYATQTV